MINSFYDKGTEDIFNGIRSKAARKTCPPSLQNVAVRKLDLLDSANNLDDLRKPPGNRLEPLLGDRKGQYSIRINERLRICFKWSENGLHDVQIVDYH